jgi:spore maturation protein CgeB
MRLLLAHVFSGTGPSGEGRIVGWLTRLRAAGIDVNPVQVAMPVPGRRMRWRDLDAAWRRGDRHLMELYERLAVACESADVLINYGGVNLHPDFLSQLGVVSVLGFFDDPESSAEFSEPVAAGHDACLVGNIAELDAYRRWGAKLVAWWPNGFRADDYDPALTEEQILSGERDVPVTLLCERVTHYRRQRVDRFAAAFPEGAYYGPGWPTGFLPEPDRVPLLQRSRIGVNLHNSTGPINFRTFYLPANGVLQVCDNRTCLGRVFALDREVVGFDTVDEAIDRCRYFLAHDDERRAVAAAGWRRALRDYTEVAAFGHLLKAVGPIMSRRPSATEPIAHVLTRHRHRTRGRRILSTLAVPIVGPVRLGRRIVVGLARRALKVRDDASFRLERRRARSDL